MANTQAMCTQAHVDMMNGKHAMGTSVTRGTTAADTYKAALYLATATVNSSTTVYSATGEVSGTNYTAGGVTVTTATAPTLTNGVGHFTPSASIVFTNVTLSTAFDAFLLYNSTQGNIALSVHTFGSQTVTAGDFTITMPTDNDTTGLIRVG